MERIDASPLILELTPSDSTVYDPPLKGVRVGVEGNITVQSGRNSVEILDAKVGEHIPGEISKVYATGTTATDIIGWRWRNK